MSTSKLAQVRLISKTVSFCHASSPTFSLMFLLLPQSLRNCMNNVDGYQTYMSQFNKKDFFLLLFKDKENCTIIV